ncbi:putative Transmembrane protein [Melia azedarach]|uniref:Transmembrane protein n=1 Tax=Melia azedarach TaxID=155640 RepID=A0ACC1WWB4_MELAZ|nr:putative Transmembrane protein [Melia azedarach]
MAAASSRNGMINGGSYSQRFGSGRMIPKRGQVKLGIVLGLANSFASIFSRRSRSCAGNPLSRSGQSNSNQKSALMFVYNY